MIILLTILIYIHIKYFINSSQLQINVVIW